MSPGESSALGIEPGEVVIIKPVNVSQIQIGDVVLAGKPHATRLGRVRSVDRDGRRALIDHDAESVWTDLDDIHGIATAVPTRYPIQRVYFSVP